MFNYLLVDAPDLKIYCRKACWFKSGLGHQSIRRHAAIEDTVRLLTGARYPDWVLVTCILASSLAFVDSSVTNVALPAIGQSPSRPAAPICNG